jgi:hypothetical protein
MPSGSINLHDPTTRGETRFPLDLPHQQAVDQTGKTDVSRWRRNYRRRLSSSAVDKGKTVGSQWRKIRRRPFSAKSCRCARCSRTSFLN